MDNNERNDVQDRRTANKIFVAILIPLIIMGIVFTTLYFDNPMGRRIRHDFSMGEISPLHGGGMVGLVTMLVILGIFFAFSIWLWRAMTHPTGKGDSPIEASAAPPAAEREP